MILYTLIYDILALCVHLGINLMILSVAFSVLRTVELLNVINRDCAC